MTTPTGDFRPSRFPPARRQALLGAAIIVAAAFALRCWQFGDPSIHVDENFYLLVGDRMLHGATPYVDIWDRKPVGLFLLFAGIRLLGGDGIVQYQVVATLFAAGTGLLIARIAQPMAGRIAGVAAALVYLLLIGLVGGSGGQAPVFYNLLMAGAALAVMRVVIDPAATSHRVRQLGCLAMLLIGLALQIKYSVVFEGVFLGLALMWASWRASPRPMSLILDSLLWIELALLPTVLALGWYAEHHQAAAFIYANFLSIGERSGASGAVLIHRLLKAATVLALPLLAVGLAIALKPWRTFPRGPASFAFVLAWLVSALAGYLLFGTYFDHYALPLFVPLAAAAAPLFSYRPRRLGLVAAAVLLAVGGAAYATVVHKMHLKRGGRAEMDEMVTTIEPRLDHGRGLYVWNGDSILYHLTGAALPGRWPFAGHLNLLRENGAIGVDQATEVRRIFAAKPRVVVDHEPAAKDFNFEVVAIVRAELARDYRPVKVMAFNRSRTVIYERIPGK